MTKKLIYSSILFLLIGISLAFADEAEVRYDLILIETFDGVGISYYEPEQINLSGIQASSILSGRYSADKIADGDLRTAWIEGVSGYGIGSTITVPVDFNRIPRTIGIWPGFQTSQSIFERNGRPLSLKIRYIANDPDSPVGDVELASFEVNLITDYNGRVPNQAQYIQVSSESFLQNMAFTELKALEITILDVDSDGATDPDMAISEIVLYMEGELVGVRGIGF